MRLELRDYTDRVRTSATRLRDYEIMIMIWIKDGSNARIRINVRINARVNARTTIETRVMLGLMLSNARVNAGIKVRVIASHR